MSEPSCFCAPRGNHEEEQEHEKDVQHRCDLEPKISVSYAACHIFISLVTSRAANFRAVFRRSHDDRETDGADPGRGARGHDVSDITIFDILVGANQNVGLGILLITLSEDSREVISCRVAESIHSETCVVPIPRDIDHNLVFFLTIIFRSLAVVCIGQMKIGIFFQTSVEVMAMKKSMSTSRTSTMGGDLKLRIAVLINAPFVALTLDCLGGHD